MRTSAMEARSPAAGPLGPAGDWGARFSPLSLEPAKQHRPSVCAGGRRRRVYNQVMQPKVQAGFTLLELLTVISIAAILMAIAIPQFQSTGLSAARASGGRMLLTAFNQARSEAIARNRTVNVCRRDFFSTYTASPRCAVDSGRWVQGWIVYQDTDASFDGTEPDSPSDIIGVFEPIGTVTANGEKDAFKVSPTGNPGVVSFGTNGRPTQALSFTLCDRTGHLKDSRRVDLSLSGHASLRALSVADTSSACAS